jgi:hypothetical protein
MKRFNTLLIIISLIFGANIYAQTAASALWVLTADQTGVATGNVVVTNQVLTGLDIKDYTGGTMLPNAQRLWNTAGANWPTETGPNSARLASFQISPKAGYTFTVKKISYYKAAYGTHGRMHANVAYDYNSAFSNPVWIDTTGQADGGALPFGIPDARDNAVPRIDRTVNLVIGSGQTLSVGFFPWYSTTPSATKYFCLDSVKIEGTTAPAVGIEKVDQIPTTYTLDQNYPNPFNPTTKISFTLEKAGYTTLSVYNVLGQKMASLLANELAVGRHEVNFDASKLTSGIYLYRLDSGNFTSMKKMMLLK